MTVFVTGATGLVGRRLLAALALRSDRVVALSRKTVTLPNSVQVVVGDPSQPGSWLDSVDECDAVVHLAGENIFAKRWSTRFMAEIERSRVDSTRNIAERLARQPRTSSGQEKVFVSASAVGYYGTGERPCDEASSPGDDFMAHVCLAWEAAAEAARSAGVRVVHPRLGIVLDRDGGALPNLARPFRWFVGGPVGRGRHGVCWIHRDDVTNALIHLLTHEIDGPVNLVAPGLVSNREFSEMLAKVLHRPCWLPVPPLLVRLALGRVAEIATKGQWVSPRRLVESGFSYCYADLPSALANLFPG